MKVRVPQRWGFCFKGNEVEFSRALADVAAQFPGGMDYWEIGIGHGDTMLAADDVLCQAGVPYRVTGVDVARYGGHAIQPSKMGGRFQGVIAPEQVHGMPWKSINVCLTGSAEFLSRVQHRPAFVFIDACHCYECPKREFLEVEKRILPGGIVIFHDTDPWCQGRHSPQPCGGGIDVRRAVQDLGLLDGSRDGWDRIDELFGQPPDSHGILIVRRQRD